MASLRLPRQTFSLSLLLGVLGGAVFLVSFAAGRAFLRDIEPVQRWLAWFQPRATLACGALCLLGLMACRREIWDATRGISRADWLMVAGVLALAAATRIAWVPASERLYFDEHAYCQIADAIASEGMAQLAGAGRMVAGRLVTDLPVHEHWPAGWPTALAIALQATGGAHGAGPALNLILTLCTTLLVALIASRARPAGRLPLVAATLHACVPAVGLWSRTGAAEPMAAFLGAAALFVATVVARTPALRAQILLGAVCALGAMTRNESLFIIPVALLVAGSRPAGFAWGHSLPALTIAIWLLPAQALHLGVVGRGYDADTRGSGLGLAFASHNLASLGHYLTHEPVMMVLVLLAAFTAYRRAALPLIAWAVAGLVPWLFYFAGSLDYPGGERFVLSWLSPCTILAAAGVIRLDAYCARWRPAGLRMVVGSAYVVACLAWLTIYVRRADAGVAIPRREIAALRLALRNVPQDGVVAAAYPFVILAEHRSAIPLADADSPRRICALVRRRTEKVFLWIGPAVRPAARLRRDRSVDDLTNRCDVVPADAGDGTAGGGRLYEVRDCTDCLGT